MGKILIGVIGVFAGIFVGALAVEVLNRKKPGLIKEIGKKAKNAVGNLAAAFKEGFKVKGEAKPIRPEQSPDFNLPLEDYQTVAVE